jgi:hypothetical protein
VGRRRTAVGLGLESEPITGKGTVPIGGTHLSARERGREEEAGRAGKVGRGGAAGPREGEREEEKKGRPRVRLHREREIESGLGQLGRAGGGGNAGLSRAPREKREKEKERVG